MKEFTPDKYLGHKINRISRSIDRYFDRKRCSKTECIPRSQGMMIGYIMDNQGQNIFQKDIEEELDIRRSSVTSVLKLMEKNGYIKRVSVSEDARLKKIVLTKRGLEIQRNVYASIIKIEESLRDELSEDEINIFISLVDKLSKKIDE